MISSVVPCLYVAVYAEAQPQNKDSNELGAAMAAVLRDEMVTMCSLRRNDGKRVLERSSVDGVATA